MRRIFRRSLVVRAGTLLGVVAIGGCSVFGGNSDEGRLPEPQLKEVASQPASERAMVPSIAVVSNEEQRGRYLRQLARGYAAPLNRENVGYYMDVQFAMLQQKLSGQDVHISRGANEIHIVLPGTPTFSTGSDRIDPQAMSVLSVISEVLAEYNKTLVTVLGHTDASGDELYNKVLAHRRAGAVGRYLTEHNVGIERLLLMSLGSAQPIASNDSAEGRAKNRRVELVLHPILADSETVSRE